MRTREAKNEVTGYKDRKKRSLHKKSFRPQRLSKKVKTGNTQKTQPKTGSEKQQSAPLKAKAKIFVGGIPSNFTSQDLLEYFQTFGEVLAIKLKTKKKNVNVNLGFGTITIEASTADKILETNFHYIQDRKVECQRYVKSKKSRSNLIKDKKLKTLHITEPPDSMNERNLKRFFEKFGKVENCYILPERRVPFPEKTNYNNERSLMLPTKYDFLKRKALILFETVEAARTVYRKSQQRKVIFDGVVIKVIYKCPDQVKQILHEREKLIKQTGLQNPSEKEEEAPEETDFIVDCLPEENEEELKKDQLTLRVEVLKEEKSCKNLRKGKKIQKNNKKSDLDKFKQNSSSMRINKKMATQTRMFSIPVLSNKECQQKAEKNTQKINKKSQKNNQNNHTTPGEFEISTKNQISELAQAELLENLPNHLKRSRNYIRPRYFLGFWGNLIQKLEEHRRHFKPGQTRYSHTDHQPLHSTNNIRVNIKKGALKESTFSSKSAPSIFCMLHSPRGQVPFQRLDLPVFTKGDTFNESHFLTN